MDMSQKPEGATHYVEGSCSPWEKRIGDDWFTFNCGTGEWWCCSRGTGDTRLETESGMAPLPIEPTVTNPTLETMLAEWRDLEARAQVAQAEADALFEHAGQCHGEIVVRLAELGWGAPRAPMVPGEPVVTLDTPECCKPTDDERKLLANGDYTPDELWGGSRPTCPKCIDRQTVVNEPVVTLDTPLDMTDWRNWQVGDIVKRVRSDHASMMSVGEEGPIKEITDHPTNPIRVDLFYVPNVADLEWISRPSTQP